MHARLSCLSRRFGRFRIRAIQSRAGVRGARHVALSLWALSLVALPSTSHAQNEVYGLIAVGELLIPDLQYEWGPGTDDAHTTMVWPLSMHAVPMDLGKHLGLGLEARIELQVRPGEGVRGGFATRVPVYFRDHGTMTSSRARPAVYGEAGLVGGNAGTGTLLGGGVSWGARELAVLLGYRTLDLAGIGRRHTVGLDLHFSFDVGEWLCVRKRIYILQRCTLMLER